MKPIITQHKHIGMKILPASLTDVAELTGVEAQCYVDAWGADGLLVGLQAEDTTVLVAVLCNQSGKRCGPVEGYLVYRESKNSNGHGAACILCMGVLVDSRRRGIASRLLEAVPGMGIRGVYAEVIGKGAYRLFTKVGFQEIGCMSCGYLMQFPIVKGAPDEGEYY